MASPDSSLPTNREPARRPMTDDELVALCTREIENATDWSGSRLATDRRKSLDAYFGEPYGNEREGRSKVVSRDVLETVEWIMPSLMEIFFSGDEVVRFDPVGPEDIQTAEQETALCNQVFSRDNDGFMLGYTWFKDALTQKNGVVMSVYEVEYEYNFETYTGLDDVTLALVCMAGGDVEPRALTSNSVTTQDPQTGQPVESVTYDVTLERRTKNGKIKLYNVPPENFGISKDAIDIDQARFIFHRVQRSEAELLELGFDPAVVRGLPAGESDRWQNTDSQIRRSQEGGTTWADTAREDAARPIWITECWLRVDKDGDGRAEMRKVTLAGDEAKTLLLEEEVDSHPFSSLTPIPIPHRFYGLSVADLTMDLQEIHTTIWRQYLDALYLENNPRHVVLANGDQGAPLADLDELLSSHPGGYVTEYAPNAIRPLIQQGAAGSALPGMEHVQGIRENRVGVTRYNAGLDANTLNKTATGVSLIQNAAMQRIGLIARIFAETGVRHLFKRISKLLREHQDKPRVVRLRGEYVEVDPTAWRGEMDATISVGIGHGNRDSLVAGLSHIIQLQAQANQVAPGLLVGPKQAYNALKDLTEKLGFKGAASYWQDPTAPDAQIPPPQPDPAMVKVEQDGKLGAARLMLDRDKMLLDHHAKLADMHLKAGLMPPPMPDLTTVPQQDQPLTPGGPPPIHPPEAPGAAAPMPAIQ